MAGRWVDVGEAARELDINTDAVRELISRGSLRSDRHGVLVWLDDRLTKAGREDRVDCDASVVEDLRKQVHYLREVLNEERDARRRAETIIAQLTQANAALAQRVSELEVPQEPRGAPETAAAGEARAVEEPHLASGGAQEPSERPPDTAEWPVRGSLLRPWWRRAFGGWNAADAIPQEGTTPDAGAPAEGAAAGGTGTVARKLQGGLRTLHRRGRRSGRPGRQ